MVRLLSHNLKVGRLELHFLVEVTLVHLLLHILVDVHVHVFFLSFFLRSVYRISLPSSLLLIVVILVFFHVGTVDAVAKLSTFDSFLKAETILFLALRLFASAVDQIFYVRLVAIELFEVVKVLDVLFFYFGQDGLIDKRLLRYFFFVDSPSPCRHQKIILHINAFRTALPNNTNLARRQKAAAVNCIALLVILAVALMDNSVI